MSIKVWLIVIVGLMANISYGQTPIPYFNNFDATAADWSAPISNPFTNWELGLPTIAPTNTTHSGSSCWDINLNSAYNTQAGVSLYSPIFLMGNSPYQVLSFWQNYSTEENFDGMRIEYSPGNGSWYDLGSANEPAGANWFTHPDLNFSQHPGWEGNSNGWIKSTYKITGFNNQQVQFRFLFISNGSITGAGVSVDDFSLVPAPPIDLGITNVTYNQPLNIGTVSDSITVSIKNFGATPVYQFTVSYNYNSSIQTKFCTDTLVTGASINVKLPGFMVTDTATLCANLLVTGDGYLVDNDHCDTVTGHTFLQLPYFNDFELAATGWLSSFTEPSTIWQLGTPTFAPTNSTHSGNTCWDINFTTTYGNDAYATLETPIFLMDNGPYQVLSFWQNFQTEYSWDGTRLEYSVAGAPWTVLGIFADTNATNWYTEQDLHSSSLPAWEDNSNGWIKSSYKIWGVNNQPVQFRFVFTSDNSGTEAGISIDDFSLTPQPAIDLGVTGISVNSVLNIGSVSDSVTVFVKNFTPNPAGPFTVSYTYNSTTESIIFSGLLAGYATVAIKLPGFMTITNSALCGSVLIAGDAESINDNFCDTVFGHITYPISYFNDFDAAAIGWVSETNNSLSLWEHGTPNYGITSSTHSGNSWSPWACRIR